MYINDPREDHGDSAHHPKAIENHQTKLLDALVLMCTYTTLTLSTQSVLLRMLLHKDYFYMFLLKIVTVSHISAKCSFLKSSLIFWFIFLSS